ncbi:MAG: serine--tRNA ligase, partial [Haloarculaceae archaeon]
MLSRRFVREHPEAVRDGLELRHNDDVDLDEILALDEEWRDLKAEGDDLRHRRNEVSSRIGQLKQEGEEEEARAAIEESQDLKERIEAVEERAEELDAELERRLLEVPNVPHEDVPPGEDETDNVEVRREFFADHDAPADPVPHYDLGEELNILSFDRGAKVTGGGFYFLQGDGARLEHALIQFMLDVHREQGYTDVHPPIPVSSRSMRGTGQLPKFNEDAYRVGGGEHEA